MRISDWSSDVCSSDLLAVGAVTRTQVTKRASIDDEIAGVRTGGAHRTDDAAVLKTDDLKVAAADRGGSGIVAGATCEPLDPCSVFDQVARAMNRSEEHTSELQSLMRISYAVFCLKKKK